MEKVTGVALAGKSEDVVEKLKSVFRNDFDFFADTFPFSFRVSADEKKMSFDDSKSPECYVENGLVLPEGVESVSFSVPVRGIRLQDDKVNVELYPNKDIPGLYYVSVQCVDRDGTDMSRDQVAFLDGKKVARAAGFPHEEIEHGELDKKGNFRVTDSKARPEAVREPVQEAQKPEPVVEKKPRKSVLEQNIEAGFPDRIKDMNTGFNRVYMKTFAGDFDKLNHADLFPRDPNAACPVLADAKVNLGDMTLLAVTITPKGNKQDVSLSYSPAVFEMNLSHYENDYTAYGPALSKNLVAGVPKAGRVYYMDVTGMEKKDLKKMEACIREAVRNYNAERGQSKKLEDILVKETMAHGAKSPVLAIGKEFDATVRRYEAQEIQAQKDAEIRREQAEKELEARNAAIKEEVKAKKRAGEYIERERRDQIFVHKPVVVRPEHGAPYAVSLLEPPDKEKGEDYFKLKFKAGYREMEIRIPKASKELGKDGLPLSYVKTVKDKTSDVAYVLNVSPKLGKQFPAYCNGMPTGTSIGYSEMYSYMELKNQEFRDLESRNTDKWLAKDEERQKNYGRMARESAPRRSLRPGRDRYSRNNGNNGYGDGM